MDEELDIVLVLPIVIFSPILAIKATKLSSTVISFFILLLFNSLISEFFSLLSSLNSLTKFIKSSFFATKSVSQFTSISEICLLLSLTAITPSLAKEGVIAVSDNNKQISLIEVNCETDFVAKNDDFINFVKELSELNNEKNSDINELNKSKMKNDITVEDNLVALIAKIGEKITIGKTKTISSSSSTNYRYLHTVVKDNLAKLAVIVSIETKDNSEIVKTFGKQLSMHIAASNPLALKSEMIEKSVIDKEQELVN